MLVNLFIILLFSFFIANNLMWAREYKRKKFYAGVVSSIVVSFGNLIYMIGFYFNNQAEISIGIGLMATAILILLYGGKRNDTTKNL